MDWKLALKPKNPKYSNRQIHTNYSFSRTRLSQKTEGLLTPLCQNDEQIKRSLTSGDAVEY